MQKKHIFRTASLFIAGICFAGVAAAADIEGQISSLQQQMQQMQQQMEALQGKLQQAQQDAESAQKRAETAAQEAEASVAEVAGRFKALDDLQQRFGHLKIGGYVRSRWWDGDDQQSSFDVTEIALNMRYDVSENISGQFHLWYHPSTTGADARRKYRNYSGWAGPNLFVESAFAEFRNLNLGPVQGTLIAGKTRNLAYAITPGGGHQGRITSDYSLFDQTNAMSRIVGLQYLTKYKDIKWNFAVFNGWYLGLSPQGNRPGGVLNLKNQQENLDGNSNKAFSTRLGWAPSVDALKGFEVGATYFDAALSGEDLAAFNTAMGRNVLGTPSSDDRHRRYGLDARYYKGPFIFQAAYFEGEISDVDASWWYVMAGYCLKQYNVDFFLRYSEARYDQNRVTQAQVDRYRITNPAAPAAAVNYSAAWDKSELTPLIVYHLHPRAKLYFEYYFNWEDVPRGVSRVDNDYGFVELILFY